MDKLDNQFEHKIYLCGLLHGKCGMLNDLGIQTLGGMADDTQMINDINCATVMVSNNACLFEVGYMYARLQVYDTFTNLPKERKPRLVIIREETELADIINLPTWEAFLRWLKK